ncbi:Cell division protein ZapA [Geopseudomonas sagittaria]|uniref:Cell division protein ZapA n=1 Tax=Geopseudomonas sagittaria TaxID=1135990 RepID=A0A1I5W1W9_9GAMM|nr:cell division protein ZapA [Pseudomonas sagittaria]SFQ13742.1 Cell division protein ZapA [Pseudomonas sagittaria]
MKETGVRVLKILGRDYSVRASASEEAVLQQAAALLQQRVNENQQRFPAAGSQELLVLTALNLCVPLLEQGEQLRAVQERLAASVELISRQLRV